MEQRKATLHQNLPIIQVADGLLLDTLLADAQAAQCILTRLSDQTAIVSPGKFEVLLARLRRLGHLPKVLPE